MIYMQQVVRALVVDGRGGGWLPGLVSVVVLLKSSEIRIFHEESERRRRKVFSIFTGREKKERGKETPCRRQ